MHETIPFDPPYLKRINTPNGDQWVQVQVDGNEISCEPPPSLQWTAAPAAAPKSGKPGVTILNVPYAEKDEAKQLGARWDAARKKWYIPQGVDAEPFSRWTAGK